MLQNLAYFGLLLGVLVTVHELGHFLVAKACNVKVLRFSIGFGPSLLKFKRGETEYQIAALPLGGYVKMAGDMPDEELPPAEAKRGFLAQPPWKRGLIVAAGPAFNLIFPVLVYFVVFFGAQEYSSSRIGGVEPGLPAAAAGLRAGDRIAAIDGEPIRTFDEVRTALRSRYDREITLTVERDGQTFTTQVTPSRNVETDPFAKVTSGMIGITSHSPPPVLGVPEGSVAHAAGLRTFDRLLSINGQPVKGETGLNALTAEASGLLQLEVMRGDEVTLPGVLAQLPRLVKATVEKQAGIGYAALGAERADLYAFRVLPGTPAEKAGIFPGDKLLAWDGQPIPSWALFSLRLNAQEQRPFKLTVRDARGAERTLTVAQALTTTKDELGQERSAPELGLRMRPLGAGENVVFDRITLHLGVKEALLQSLQVVPDIIAKTVVVLGRLITGDIPFENVGGPIMLYEVAAKTAEQGTAAFLQAMAVISVNLGIMNLLPIPILDGFHLVAALWEGIRRRPIPIRAREIANWVGLCMLIVLMVLVMKNDLTR